ncbi:protein ABHD11-like [Homarus americanus]|uniref:protein ABHD11-like n=1 Tax=Homarus americanus TaxID=6706 RepID=UPI001C443FFA|nr:protein ABHD11-like [Homarus americanus]
MKNFLRTTAKYLNFHRYIKLPATQNDTRQLSTSSKWDVPISMAYSSFQTTLPDKISNKPPVVIMHGLMGNKLNWKSIGKALNEKTGRLIYAVDARNHGDSPHAATHNYPLLAEDILYFLKEHNIPKAVLIGHSMGGRAVMAAALLEPSVVDKLMVMDMSPIRVSDSINYVPRFMDIMRRIEVPAHLTIQEARTYVDELLKPAIVETAVRQFLLTNLVQVDGGYKWRINVNTLAVHFHPYITTFPILDKYRSFEGDTAFIAGELSDYIRKDDEDKIMELFPQATFHYIEGAGHWLHVDKPKEVIELIVSLLEP